MTYAPLHFARILPAMTRLIRAALSVRAWLDRRIWDARNERFWDEAVKSPVFVSRVKAGMADLNARRLVDWDDE